MFNKIKKVSMADLLGFIKFFIIIIPAVFYRYFLKIKRKELWLICETKNTARDNGYVFFKYMLKKRSNIKVYYAIDFKADDYKKIKGLKNVIQWSSFKHYFYYISATLNISSHKEGNPNQTLFTIIHLYLRLLNNRVFLQHGVIKDDTEMFYYKRTYFKYFICGAKDEYNFILKKFGYPDGSVAYTGLARFDNLHKYKTKKQILLIPTWRRWFELDNNEETFKKSNYFNCWNRLINDSELYSILNENEYELVFYPHEKMKKYIKCFNSKYKNVKIINHEYDLQELLKESSIMITDYSSVFMDFAYMKKPVIYYQFDYKDYRKSHFKEGYFSYKENGFGPVYDKIEDVILEIKDRINNDNKVKEEYYNRMNSFFELNDNKNCDRIFDLLTRGNYEK